ncbi:hypothetical protein H0H87_007974 [Tephrocybe sp. NHM501043]|nr:hypothetical protein H0H87_007974 [Tephrocybe sp. NHM501043]
MEEVYVGNAPLNRHRASRSEDYRFSASPTSQDNNGFLNVTNNSSSTSNSAGLLFPPTSHNDFLRQQLAQPQFLSPNNVRVPELLPTNPHHQHSASLSSHPQQVRGHYRSASGGSRPRSERGSSAGWDGGLDLSSARANPYPSPNASPRGRLQPLEHAEDIFDFSGVESGSQNGVDARGLGLSGTGGGPTQAKIKGPILVSKPNVTTGRTANASQRRRKQEATFVCPVQGCGSTFTRSFNLKGHIRSHNEEKPFQCHWPGCGKGFARQHDCKRHEQLHTNYRPFNCEGCGKQFARMDALNRHLKSEGGADCSKQLDASASPPDSAASNASNNNTSIKAPLTPQPLPAQLNVTNGYPQRYGPAAGGGDVKIKMDEAWGVGLGVAL